MNRFLNVWETLLSFSKYFLSNTFSQNIDNYSVAFSLLFSIYYYWQQSPPLINDHADASSTFLSALVLFANSRRQFFSRRGP